jgi:hypothetical protein
MIDVSQKQVLTYFSKCWGSSCLQPWYPHSGEGPSVAGYYVSRSYLGSAQAHYTSHKKNCPTKGNRVMLPAWSVCGGDFLVSAATPTLSTLCRCPPSADGSATASPPPRPRLLHWSSPPPSTYCESTPTSSKAHPHLDFVSSSATAPTRWLCSSSP